MTVPRTARRTAGRHATRHEVLAAVTAAMRDTGARWGWQGTPSARATWVDSRDAKDLDVWCDAAAAERVDAALDALPSARIADARDPRRLRHVSRAVETADGLAVVDVTYGDLRVGPVLLVPGDEVEVGGGDEPAPTGVAAAADLLVRPLLRGRIPDGERVDAARTAWAAAPSVARTRAADRWRAELGEQLADDVVATLDGAPPATDLAARARRQLVRRTVAPSGVAAAWRQRHAVVPAGRSAGPLGLRTRGVVVVLVGTDGAGKSTVGEGLAERLQRNGFRVRTAYFGMARGNLPGVALARRLLGVAPAGDGAEPVVVEDEPEPVAAGPDDPRAGLSQPMVRRVAAWYYAGEYAWRYASSVWPGTRRREVVICDRYVYDLRESPWPGSLAAKVAELVVPRPDVLLLPDAPVELIHARKPERSLADQTAQQERFRALVASRPSRVAEVVVDTSGDDDDGVAEAVAAVVTAAHRPKRARRG